MFYDAAKYEPKDRARVLCYDKGAHNWIVCTYCARYGYYDAGEWGIYPYRILWTILPEDRPDVSPAPKKFLGTVSPRDLD